MEVKLLKENGRQVTTKRLLLLGVFLLIEIGVNAQTISQAWNKYLWSGGWGTTAFFGDIGGTSRNGSNLSWLSGTDLSTIHPAYSLGLTRISNRKLTTRYKLLFSKLEGQDFNSVSKARRERSLNFSTQIIEASFQMEYRVVNLLGKSSRKLRLDYYVFAGAGFLYFEPKAVYNNKLVSLRKLGTEGQGLIDGTKIYKPLTVVVPIGGGLRYEFGRNVALYGELTFHFTYSDYLDDVSGNYYYYDAIKQHRGIMAADLSFGELSERSVNLPRGNPTSKDSYISLTLGVVKSIYAGNYKARAPRPEDFKSGNKF